MASAEFVDPYLDPATGLLRNKVDARTKVALEVAVKGAEYFLPVPMIVTEAAPTDERDAAWRAAERIRLSFLTENREQ